MAVVVAVIMTWEILVQCRREDSEAMKALSDDEPTEFNTSKRLLWDDNSVALYEGWVEYRLISESYCEPRCRWPEALAWGNESLRYVVICGRLGGTTGSFWHYNKLKSTDEEITGQNSCLTSFKALKLWSLKAWIQRAEKAELLRTWKLKFNFRNFKIRVLQRVPTRKKCSLQGSNLRPQGYEPCVLTIYTKEAPSRGWTDG